MNEPDQIHRTMADHDLLVRVDEKLLALTTEMYKVTNKLEKVDALEDDMVGKVEFAKLILEVEGLKMWRWVQFGALIILSTIVIPMGVYIFKLQTSDIDTRYLNAVKQALSDYETPSK